LYFESKVFFCGKIGLALMFQRSRFDFSAIFLLWPETINLSFYRLKIWNLKDVQNPRKCLSIKKLSNAEHHLIYIYFVVIDSFYVNQKSETRLDKIQLNKKDLSLLVWFYIISCSLTFWRATNLSRKKFLAFLSFFSFNCSSSSIDRGRDSWNRLLQSFEKITTDYLL